MQAGHPQAALEGESLSRRSRTECYSSRIEPDLNVVESLDFQAGIFSKDP